jgi:hypothetical protein
MRAGADLRLLRAAVFAAACAALAAAGHLAAAGPGIALWALALGWAAVFAVAAPLAGRERRSTPAIAAALATGQLALHCLYCLGQHGGEGGGAHGASGGGVMAQAARLLCNDHALHLTGAEATGIVTAAGLDPAAPDPHQAGATAESLADAVATLGSVPMLLGHLLAATAAAWLLRRGEAALWRLVRLSTRTVAQALAFFLNVLKTLLRALRLGDATPSYAPVARPPHRGHHAATATTGTVLPHAVTRRGPPPAHPHKQLILAA